MPSDGREPRPAPSPPPASPDAIGSGRVAASDARVARVYAFLAAALAGDQPPEPQALAAELARSCDVQALAVLHDDGDDLVPVVAFGFAGDPVEELGLDLLEQAFGDGLPVLADGDAPHRQRFAVPASYGGHPWGVVAVSSALDGGIDEAVRTHVSEVAQGIAVVLAPLVPAEHPTANRERRLREGLEAVVRTVADVPSDASARNTAKALVDAMAREFGWSRVLIAQERPDLGVLPFGVGGDVRASDVRAPSRLQFGVGPAGGRDQPAPFFAGSRSQLLVGMQPPPGAAAAALVVESEWPEAFSEVDEHVARTVAALAGPLLHRLLAAELRLVDREEQGLAQERQRRRFTSLAHELRTPVTVMLGYADLLATPGPDSDQRQAYASTLARHARALGRMVDNALVAWQLDDHTLELSIGPIDLHESVLEAIQSLEAEIPVDRVGHVVALADQYWMPKVVAALLDNARRYVPDADVQVAARVEGDRVKLSVHDDGPGINSDELVHIFDAFHRGEDGGTTPHRGVGLGLTVARSLVREMGGDIEAASAQGYGTTFTVTLPRG